MFAFYLLTISAQNFAILLNSSKGFKNFRHMANIHTVNSILRRYDFESTNILAYYPEDVIPTCVNKTFIYNDIKWTPIHKTGYTTTDFLNGIMCNNKVLRYASQNYNLLIYMCGHGTNGIFKFYNKDWLTKKDLMSCLKLIHNRFKKILLIVDTCQAETMVDRDIENVYIITTSIENESSYSSHFSVEYGVSYVDNFIYSLHKVIQKTKNDLSLNILCKLISDENIGSTLTWTNDDTFMFSDFFCK